MANKSKTKKLLMSSFKDSLNFYKESGANFLLSKSNYTASLIFPNGEKVSFYEIEHTKRTFMAYRMIQSDLQENWGLVIDLSLTLHNSIEYYRIGNKISYEGDAVNIDLNNAYAQTLFNLGLISQKTLSFLLSLDKKERLVSVGMLAKKKSFFEFLNGKVIRSYTEKGNEDERAIFFKVSQIVDNLMKNLARYFGKRTLFYWVDGIYVESVLNKDKKMIAEICEGYQYKIDYLTNFSLIRDAANVNIDFLRLKDGKSKSFLVSDNELRKIKQNIDMSEVIERAPSKLLWKIGETNLHNEQEFSIIA